MSTLADYYHSQRTRRILSALIRVAMPPEAQELGIVQDVVDRVEVSMQASPAEIRTAQLLGLNVFEEIARLYPFAPGRPFSQHDAHSAERYFRAWWSSPIHLQHEFVRLFKVILSIEYYDLPIIRERMAYTPEAWVAKVARRRLESYGDEIRRVEASNLTPEPLLDALNHAGSNTADSDDTPQTLPEPQAA